jgi:hypothetical protein
VDVSLLSTPRAPWGSAADLAYPRVAHRSRSALLPISTPVTRQKAAGAVTPTAALSSARIATRFLVRKSECVREMNTFGGAQPDNELAPRPDVTRAFGDGGGLDDRHLERLGQGATSRATGGGYGRRD